MPEPRQHFAHLRGVQQSRAVHVHRVPYRMDLLVARAGTAGAAVRRAGRRALDAEAQLHEPRALHREAEAVARALVNGRAERGEHRSEHLHRQSALHPHLAYVPARVERDRRGRWR